MNPSLNAAAVHKSVQTRRFGMQAKTRKLASDIYSVEYHAKCFVGAGKAYGIVWLSVSPIVRSSSMLSISCKNLTHGYHVNNMQSPPMTMKRVCPYFYSPPWAFFHEPA